MMEQFPPHSSVAFPLPLELLQKIFPFLMESEDPEIDFAQLSTYSIGRPDWRAISHVCHYWRSASLNLPELWSSIVIPGTSFLWLKAMIERSSSLPMRIIIRICISDPATGIKSLAASELLSASRIRTLNLSGRPTDVLTVLNRFCSPSPLESLSIKVFDSWHVDLPEALFDRNAPHLHRLALESFAYIRAPLWILTRITHFTTHAGISLHELFNTLKVMPQLEMLRIVRDFHDAIVEPEQELSHVALPRLLRLSIRERNLDRLVMICSHIDAPPTLRKHLHISPKYLWECNTNVLPDMKALIPHDSALGEDNGGLRVAQVAGGPTGGTFDVWSRTISERASAVDTAAFAREDALLLLRIEWIAPIYYPYCRDRNDKIRPFVDLAKFCSQLCTGSIEDLTAVPRTPTNYGTGACDAPDAAAQWHELLSELPAVRNLSFHRGSTTCLSLLRALSVSAGLLPLLRKVFVVRCIVRYAVAAATEGWDDVGNSCAKAGIAMPKFGKANLGPHLVDALSGRSGLEVVLVECEVDKEALEALGKRARVQIVDECVYRQAHM